MPPAGLQNAGKMANKPRGTLELIGFICFVKISEEQLRVCLAG